ncbi:MAG: hypothetical protein ABIE74_00225 [Pseudomonadota bacterium]
MRNVFIAVNDLKKSGIIKNYALGGATALLFYAEPAATYDIDIFILFTAKQTDLIDLGPIYDFLQKKGWKPEREHIVFDGIPVQFLSTSNELVEEGVKNALEKKYEDIKIRVMSLEHLIAIMLQTNRPKDRERIGKLLEENIEFDLDELKRILNKYNLTKQWKHITNEAR